MNKESTVRASVTDNEQLHHWCPTPSQIFEKIHQQVIMKQCGRITERDS